MQKDFLSLLDQPVAGLSSALDDFLGRWSPSESKLILLLKAAALGEKQHQNRLLSCLILACSHFGRLDAAFAAFLAEHLDPETILTVSLCEIPPSGRASFGRVLLAMRLTDEQMVSAYTEFLVPLLNAEIGSDDTQVATFQGVYSRQASLSDLAAVDELSQHAAEEAVRKAAEVDVLSALCVQAGYSPNSEQGTPSPAPQASESELLRLAALLGLEPTVSEDITVSPETIAQPHVDPPASPPDPPEGPTTDFDSFLPTSPDLPADPSLGSGEPIAVGSAEGSGIIRLEEPDHAVGMGHSSPLAGHRSMLSRSFLLATTLQLLRCEELVSALREEAGHTLERFAEGEAPAALTLLQEAIQAVEGEVADYRNGMHSLFLGTGMSIPDVTRVYDGSNHRTDDDANDALSEVSGCPPDDGNAADSTGNTTGSTDGNTGAEQRVEGKPALECLRPGLGPSVPDSFPGIVSSLLSYQIDDGTSKLHDITASNDAENATIPCTSGQTEQSSEAADTSNSWKDQAIGASNGECSPSSLTGFDPPPCDAPEDFLTRFKHNFCHREIFKAISLARAQPVGESASSHPEHSPLDHILTLARPVLSQ